MKICCYLFSLMWKYIDLMTQRYSLVKESPLRLPFLSSQEALGR